MEFHRALHLAEERWGEERVGQMERERGHWVAYLWPEGVTPYQPDEGEWPWTEAHFVDTGEPYDETQPVPCDACQERCYPDQPDACLGWVPGVSYACCGHGQGTGYFAFADGSVVRGVNSVADLARWAASVAKRYGET